MRRYSDTHCKVGISFDPATRAARSQGEYGDEQLRISLASRRDAFLLEQAGLDGTRDSKECPADMTRWIGPSEIRTIPTEDMVLVIKWLHNEMQKLGPWEFSARYNRMWPSQLVICQQKAVMATTP
ncbi:hypothetical protein [Synechococcus sp. 1G10]|uniref:hypothetical protein n=1 Tax=Synechococcus sp. 1G10 TaxID=2025605 RepID=UPI000B993F17|nr:hypothetical protein [Synechococcus sp. 1G10]